MEKLIEELVKYDQKFNQEGFEFIKGGSNQIIGDKIYYTHKSKALALYYTNKHQLKITENMPSEIGLMLDQSRGRAQSVATIKELIRTSAMQGLTYLMLYLEDMYIVDDIEYFGYLRGAYTKDELQELVAYCELFEIELIPCIQTLGHLENFIRWDRYPVGDTKQVLLVGEEETYVLIDKMINYLSLVFNTNKIHIGMDEAFDMGFGNYFAKHQKVNQEEMYFNHLNKVNEICLRYNFTEVQVWSDMIFSLYNNQGASGLYNVEKDFSAAVKSQLPENIKMVYWNYWSRTKEEYLNVFKIHEKIKDDFIMAAGVHDWISLYYRKELLCVTEAALAAVNEMNVDNVLFTMWSDDGGYCNHNSEKFGIFKTLSLVNGVCPDKEMFNEIYNLNYDHIDLACELQNSKLSSEALLWDDPYYLIYLKNIYIDQPNIINETIKFHQNLRDEFAKANIDYEDIAVSLNEILIKKLVINLKFIEGNYNKEQQIDDINTLIVHIKNALNTYVSKWLAENKHHGIEIIQNRLSMQILRYENIILDLKADRKILEHLEMPKTSLELKDTFNYVNAPYSFRW